MPSFTVRRRKQRPKTPPPQEEEETPNVEEKESDEELVSEYSVTDEYIDEAFEELNLAPKTPLRRGVRFEPPNAPKRQPHNRYPTTYVPHAPQNRQTLPQRTPQMRMNSPYTRNATMQNKIMRPKQGRGGAKLRYSTHYGIAGEHLDTQTKANLLYTHCFG